MTKTMHFIFFLSLIYGFNYSSQAQNNKIANYFSDLKIQERAEKRYIQPGKHIISLLPSNNQYPLILEKSDVFIKDESTRGLLTRHATKIDALYLNYEFTLPENFFVASGFKYLRQWTYLQANRAVIQNGGFNYDHVSSFATLSFNVGAGYRFVGKNNLRFFDVHAGLSIGFTDNPIGSGGYYYNSKPYEDINGNQGVMNYGWSYQISSRYYYGFYLGISKDIRITKNLYLTARYHYQFGKNSKLTEHLIHYELPTLGINNTVRASNTAKGQMFALGLRWLFDSSQ